MPGHVVGRDAELASISDFVARTSDGAAALVLEGEAGMGKTTLWTAGVDEAEAHGCRVLRARPAENEAALSFSGLGDLLHPMLDEALDPLPPPQQRALSRALLLEEGGGPDPEPRVIGLAAFGAIRALAEPHALLLAIDDVQWLDAASAGALAYAARRLTAERVGVLLARRARHDSVLVDETRRSLPPDHILNVDVGPLELPAMHGVVHRRLGVTLPRPLLAEVHAAAGGNPFYTLEIVRVLRRRNVSVEAGQPLPVPESLHELAHGRLETLPAETRDLLLASAALQHPTLPLVEAASELSCESWLRPALEAGVVELERDRIRFTHPLLAAGAYELADPIRRAQMHARLAELVGDPEARGRHLAASVTEPDATVAAALDEAAASARARGAPREAALLLDRARELTPPELTDAAQRRNVDAAYLHFESGDSPRAERQLRSLVEELPHGDARARALVRLARVRSYEAQDEAARLFLQAIDESGGDRETLGLAHEGYAACLFRLRTRLEDAVDHAVEAARLATSLGSDGLAAEAIGSQLLAESLLGRPEAEATASRALGVQRAADDHRVLGQPLVAVAVHWWWTDRLPDARSSVLQLVERASELGDESSLPYLLILLGQVEMLIGELGSACERAAGGQDAAVQSGQNTLIAYHLGLEGLVEAQRGRVEQARVAALRALELVPETAGRPAELLARWALGHLELSLGAPAAALEQLEPGVALVRMEKFGEPGAMRFVVDTIEALIELARGEEASELLDWYEGHARRLERASALAASLRCRGLLAAQRGDVDGARAAYEQALAWHARADVPLEQGRTLVALGVAQRRAKHRREARATLEDALTVFERIGASLWAARASEELRRISGRAATPGALTPAEERVAALVAEGRTNREVAAALFLSERTVEGHLSHVFGKLGIRSRTELARVLASTASQGVAPPYTGGSPVSGGSSAP